MESANQDVLSINRIEQIGDFFKNLAGEAKAMVYLHSESEEEGENLTVRSIPADIITGEVLSNPKIYNLVVAQEGGEKKYKIVSSVVDY